MKEILEQTDQIMEEMKEISEQQKEMENYKKGIVDSAYAEINKLNEGKKEIENLKKQLEGLRNNKENEINAFISYQNFSNPEQNRNIKDDLEKGYDAREKEILSRLEKLESEQNVFIDDENIKAVFDIVNNELAQKNEKIGKLKEELENISSTQLQENTLSNYKLQNTSLSAKVNSLYNQQANDIIEQIQKVEHDSQIKIDEDIQNFFYNQPYYIDLVSKLVSSKEKSNEKLNHIRDEIINKSNELNDKKAEILPELERANKEHAEYKNKLSKEFIKVVNSLKSFAFVYSENGDVNNSKKQEELLLELNRISEEMKNLGKPLEINAYVEGLDKQLNDVQEILKIIDIKSKSLELTEIEKYVKDNYLNNVQELDKNIPGIDDDYVIEYVPGGKINVNLGKFAKDNGDFELREANDVQPIAADEQENDFDATIFGEQENETLSKLFGEQENDVEPTVLNEQENDVQPIELVEQKNDSQSIIDEQEKKEDLPFFKSITELLSDNNNEFTEFNDDIKLLDEQDIDLTKNKEPFELNIDYNKDTNDEFSNFETENSVDSSVESNFDSEVDENTIMLNSMDDLCNLIYNDIVAEIDSVDEIKLPYGEFCNENDLNEALDRYYKKDKGINYLVMEENKTFNISQSKLKKISKYLKKCSKIAYSKPSSNKDSKTQYLNKIDVIATMENILTSKSKQLEWLKNISKNMKNRFQKNLNEEEMEEKSVKSK